MPSCCLCAAPLKPWEAAGRCALLAYRSSRGPGWCSLFPELSSLLILALVLLQLHTPAAQDIIKVSSARLPPSSGLPASPLHSGHQQQMKEGERRHNGGNVLLSPDLLSNNTFALWGDFIKPCWYILPHINAWRASARSRLFTWGGGRGGVGGPSGLSIGEMRCLNQPGLLRCWFPMMELELNQKKHTSEAPPCYRSAKTLC